MDDRPQTSQPPADVQVLPTCPRCGYDLTGALGVRGESAEGTCSECGLVYRWAEVLDPERGIPGWFIEKRRTRVWYAVVGTWARSLGAPWRFWRVVQMQHPIRARRLVVFGVLATLCMHLALGAVPMWTHAKQARMPWGPGLQVSEWLGLLVNPYINVMGRSRASWRATGSWITFDAPRTLEASMVMGASLVMLMPLTPVLLRQTLRRFHVRSAHIWRVWVYSLVLLPVMALMHGYAAYFGSYYGAGMWWGAGGAGVLEMIDPVIRRPLRALNSVAPLRLWCLALDVTWVWLVWRWALGRYVRLPHAGAVAAAGVVIPSLVIVFAAMVFSRSFFEMFPKLW